MTTAILDSPPAVRPASAQPDGSDDRLLRLFALDRLPEHRRRLVCHWQSSDHGRLSSVWDPEIVLRPRR